MQAFQLGEAHLTPEILAACVDNPSARLKLGPAARARMEASWAALQVAMAQGAEIYGVNTGFGGNAHHRLAHPSEPGDEDLGRQRRLARYLDAGSGPALDPRVVRGILLARAHVLARGRSAVPPALVEALIDLFHHGGAPELPAWGSLGASGDLVTLAPLARHLEETQPVGLPGRTALAVMNGLSGVTAQVALDLVAAMHLFQWGVASSAAAGWALGIRQEAWTELLHAPPVRHHPGQVRVAAMLRHIVGGIPSPSLPAGLPIQDPYSLRCIPQVLGPGTEQLALSYGWITQELEGVSDNPIWAGAEWEPGTAFLSSGHFFGGYVAQAADTISTVLARLGDLLERQTFLLVDGTRGLPENLTTAGPGRHGLKGVHQAATALTMRLQRGAIPSAPFARSAEGHNQDVVSNAMNAATALSEQVDVLAALVAAHSTLAAQALEFRDGWQGAPDLVEWHTVIRHTMPALGDDAPLRTPLAALSSHLTATPPPPSWPALWDKPAG
jgi:histidine ammonia-lyase